MILTPEILRELAYDVHKYPHIELMLYDAADELEKAQAGNVVYLERMRA